MQVLELPDYGNHLAFLGATGSGKTVLAESMLTRFDRYIAIDTQDGMDVDGLTVTRPEVLGFSIPLFPRIRYVPDMEYLHKDVWNWVLWKILDSSTKRRPRPRIIYIDEIYHLGYGQSFPDYLPKSLTTARQRRLGYWISTQRPRQIPVPVLSEASRIFVFYLNNEDDIRYISGFARTDKKGFFDALREQKLDHSFIEIDNRRGTWRQMPKLQIS